MPIKVRTELNINDAVKRVAILVALLAAVGQLAVAQTFHTTVPGDVMDQSDPNASHGQQTFGCTRTVYLEYSP